MFYETVNLRPEKGVLGNSTFSFNQELVNSQLQSAAAKSPAVFLLLGGGMGVCASILSPVVLKPAWALMLGFAHLLKRRVSLQSVLSGSFAFGFAVVLWVCFFGSVLNV